MEPVSVITSDFVNVYVTTPENTAQCLVTKRFKKELTVADLKVSLYPLTKLKKIKHFTWTPVTCDK